MDVELSSEQVINLFWYSRCFQRQQLPSAYVLNGALLASPA